jgi:DNA invertase Pin-like site-specific DNA recombinase
MKRLFGYIRVSTTKQAEKGVSLNEQRDAITAYAEKHGVAIVGWYEEHITAAKRGRRPVFAAMLKALRAGKAEGIVIHKIDRSARNLGDWADLGELIDAGFDIHLAHEPIDLRTRGGRLSADILAVVAADFIRNNRAEAKKGFNGRLKQGIYPLGAPIGYLCRGKGGPASKPDPERAPLLRYAFERYATGDVGLHALLDDLAGKGLRNRRGNPLTLTGLLTILRNPFYAGLIRLERTGEVFPGAHEPIVRMATFERVQDILQGKKPRRVEVHDYLYRRLFACSTCGRSLIGSRAKGRVYYRCSVPACPTTCIREDALDQAVLRMLQRLVLPDSEVATCREAIEAAAEQRNSTRDASRAQLTGQLGELTVRMNRLTDVYLEGGIDKEVHDERRAALVLERQRVTDALAHVEADTDRGGRLLLQCVELLRSPEKLYESATSDEKRRLLKILTSNRIVNGKTVTLSTAEPFCFLPSAQENTSSALDRGLTSNLEMCSRYGSIAEILFKWLSTHSTRADVLLDQLVQSDPDRMPTFRAA